MSPNTPQSSVESESHSPIFSDVTSGYDDTPPASPWFKIGGLVAVLAMVVCGAWYAFQTERREGNTDQTAPQAADLGVRVRANPAPPIDVTPLGNAPEISADSLKGKIVLLNFWGTWCGPCQLEMPQLDRLGHLLTQQYPDRAQIVAVSYPATDANAQEVAETTLLYAKEHGITLPLYADPSLQLLRLYAPTGFPTTYLIDQEGFVAHVTSGYTPEDWDKLMEKLSDLLLKSEPSQSESNPSVETDGEIETEIETE